MTSISTHPGRITQSIANPPRSFRLLQNRKSAKKCRLKKKAEFGVLSEEVDNLKKQNKGFQEKVSGVEPLGAGSEIRF